MVKLLVTDLDNTLLRRDKTVSDFTLDVLANCRQQGVKLAIATGRPPRTTKPFMDLILAEAMICHNGTVVEIGEQRTQCCGIDPAETRRIMQALVAAFPGGMLSVEIDDILYANFDVGLIWNMTEAISTDFSDLPCKPADKIIVSISGAEDVQRIAECITDELYLEVVDGHLCMILHKDAEKMQGVKMLATGWGIDPEQIVAFGDGINDVGMLTGCGWGIAVANAVPEAQEAADYLCADCDEDGLAHWICEHILKLSSSVLDGEKM